MFPCIWSSTEGAFVPEISEECKSFLHAKNKYIVFIPSPCSQSFRQRRAGGSTTVSKRSIAKYKYLDMMSMLSGAVVLLKTTAELCLLTSASECQVPVLRSNLEIILTENWCGRQMDRPLPVGISLSLTFDHSGF